MDNIIYLLNNLPMFDTQTGLGYCMEDEQFYISVLQDYLAGDKREQIKEALEGDNIEHYRILLHTLKSTSLTIGAVDLSEHAKQLELAAKEENRAYIIAHTKELLEEYTDVLDSITRAFAGEKVSEENPKEADTVQHIDTSDATILVVDDDYMNIRLAENLLKQKYKVLSAMSGKEAFEVLKTRIPNLILLDINMPEMDGHQVIRQLKSSKEYESIPVIFLTADTDDEAESFGFEEGALDYIKKPFHANVALQRISRILELDYLQKYLEEEVKKETEKAERRRKRVERISSQLISSLTNAIDAKDKYTNGHSKRVAEYACMIAKQLGYDEETIEQINYTGLLHDVGKIGIPDEIINKAGKLTDKEYEVIKTHPVVGAKILEEITEIPNVSIGAKWHHERYDGTGYPDSLVGTAIPKIARIIGVADAYDAMTSRRSYRDILPQSVVRSEIVNGRGTQFDPEIADTMLYLIDQDTEYKLHE